MPGTTYDFGHLPRYVILNEDTNALSGIGTALTMGTSSIGRILTEQVARTNHTERGLIEFLQLRTITARKAHDRSRSWWGRMVNWMTGDNPRYVPITGHHLIQTLVLLGDRHAASHMHKATEYGIRVDVAEVICARLITDYENGIL